ncbi:MAG: AMP-binding protein [Anaerolineae bacterium]|nr:AMP-binding protein [Anaerolineae bacterium]
MDFSKQSIYDVFKHFSKTQGDAPAFYSANREITYAKFVEHVDQLAAGFLDRGIGKGDRICILAKNSIEFVEILIAAAKIGAISYPINWRLSPGEIAATLALAGPKMLFIDVGLSSVTEAIETDEISSVILLGDNGEGGVGEFTDLYAGVKDVIFGEVGDDDPFIIISTAAVGGAARGAVLSHHNFTTTGSQVIESFNMTANDRFLAVLPFFHIAGLNILIAAAQVGAASVIMDTFDPAAGTQMIDAQKITLMGTFPPMLEMLLDSREKLGSKWDSLKYCFGILNPPEVVMRFLSDTRAEYWTGYGQTETSGMVTFMNVTEKLGSAGKVVPGLEMRLVDDLGDEVPVGVPGEIAVRGPLVFSGYWRDDDATEFAARFGWHHTGDVGKLDDEGYLYYIGRKPEKELIKSGGENIYPAEVEHAIREMPEVVDVCVIGVPDEKWGEAVKAVIELAAGETLSTEQVSAAVVKKIASYKKPHQVVFVDSLPRNENGEVDRADVKIKFG